MYVRSITFFAVWAPNLGQIFYMELYRSITFEPGIDLDTLHLHWLSVAKSLMNPQLWTMSVCCVQSWNNVPHHPVFSLPVYVFKPSSCVWPSPFLARLMNEMWAHRTPNYKLWSLSKLSLLMPVTNLFPSVTPNLIRINLLSSSAGIFPKWSSATSNTGICFWARFTFRTTRAATRAGHSVTGTDK